MVVLGFLLFCRALSVPNKLNNLGDFLKMHECDHGGFNSRSPKPKAVKPSVMPIHTSHWPCPSDDAGNAVGRGVVCLLEADLPWSSGHHGKPIFLSSQAECAWLPNAVCWRWLAPLIMWMMQATYRERSALCCCVSACGACGIRARLNCARFGNSFLKHRRKFV